MLYLLITSTFSWGQVPPTLTATGDQYYCPLSQINITTSFSIVPGDEDIDAVFIQISENYTQGEDTLSLTGTHTNITSSWNSSEGKLTLNVISTSATSYLDLIAAVEDVVFESTNTSMSGEKSFSITIDEANYLPSTDHYYEYVASTGITWQNALTAAAAKNHYGLQGYLATITSAEEAQLSGEQAAGAGWIGGSDQETEGVWKWVTGPEAGKSFWIGNGSGTTVGTDIPFANWNTGNSEPNNLGNEDYAHVTAPGVGTSGSWNDLSNTGESSGDYQPKGYIVEYGGTAGDPVLNISASTKISTASITATTAGITCGPGSVTISATPSTGTIYWFSSNTSTTPLSSGLTYTTTISTTTNFYALASVNGCLTGKRSVVQAYVINIPTITSSTDVTICGAGTGTLTATASAGTINWYDALTGGNLVGSGTSFTTPNLVSTTTYYVDATFSSCTTTNRTPVTLNVQYTTAPTGTTTQTFCDIENATISNLIATGTSILWYASASGGTSLDTSTILTNNTTYYASQTVNTCESSNRLPVDVFVYETVVTPSSIITLEACDAASDGSDTDGFALFDLTSKETELLNGKSSSDFTITYFTSATYSSTNEISNPSNFKNTIANGQTIYVRIENNLDTTCKTETSFDIQVNALPTIQNTIDFKNCDEDGTPDGYTDFNLDEASTIITNGDSSLTVTYHTSITDANTGASTAINASPYNNTTGNTVYARVENSFGCYRVATVNLLVSTTSFTSGFMENLENCDNDGTIDGLHVFDLTLASPTIITEFPLGQNLSVHYYKNITDASLEQNEILPQSTYMSETPFSETLIVRVESDDNGDCFGIGEHLTLTVNPIPEFDVDPEATVCLNLPAITLETENPNDVYSYKWTDENGAVISNISTASVTTGGIYTVIATSGLNCQSFPQTVTVIESDIATISLTDITITDGTDNNSITINTTNLGIGDYEFNLDDSFGSYQDEPLFENVAPGLHTIYIQDKNNCGIAEIEVAVIGFPKFFTPNNDGFNDTWQIKGVSADFYATSIIYIYDRFGKIITKIDPTTEGWNGLYNGKMLPSTDYWFTAQLIDENGTIREKKGHFSLIRN